MLFVAATGEIATSLLRIKKILEYIASQFSNPL